MYAEVTIVIDGKKTRTDTCQAEHDMGLIDRGTESVDINAAQDKPWHRLIEHVGRLRSAAPQNVQYKLILNGRHGQGYHNVAQMKYGIPAWKEYYGKLDNLDGHSLVDAHLTPIGEQQAQAAGGVLLHQMSERGLPPPKSHYVSPLHRCQQTAHLTWWIVNFQGLHFRPVVKELMREVTGVDTCDRRSTRTAIAQAFPDVTFEDGFAEEDPLWHADHRETHDEHDVRTQALLDDVFLRDQAEVISFTSHAGCVASLLRVLGHRAFPMQTGALIPLVIKATKLD